MSAPHHRQLEQGKHAVHAIYSFTVIKAFSELDIFLVRACESSKNNYKNGLTKFLAIFENKF